MQRPIQPKKFSPAPHLGWLTAGMLALLLATGLGAEMPAETPAPESPARSSSTTDKLVTVPAAGLRAYVDPATGELTSTPTSEQVEALDKLLAESLSRSTEGLVPFALDRGGHGVYLEHRFQSAYVARVTADGGLTFTCVDDRHHAATVLDEQAPPPAAVEWVEK